jgi:hypothetical protein
VEFDVKSEALNIEDVVEKLEDLSLDVDSYYDHLTHGTLPDYYREVVQATAVDIIFFPLANLDRDEEFDPVQNSQQVTKKFPKVVELIATMFERDQSSVATDLTRAIQKCPVEDLKAARMLKKANKLH